MTVSYIVVRLMQAFDRFEAAPAPQAEQRHTNPSNWPSEGTRYDMEDGETTFSIGITMAPRDGVWVRAHRAVEDTS